MYKIFFMGKDGTRGEFKNDSYKIIKQVHHNIKYEQKLPVSDIMKPNQERRHWLPSFLEAATIKIKKRGGS